MFSPFDQEDYYSSEYDHDIQEVDFQMVQMVNPCDFEDFDSQCSNTCPSSQQDFLMEEIPAEEEDLDLSSLEHKLMDELRSGMTEPSKRGRVKRPLNPFMVFSRMERSKLIAPGMNNAKISKLLGERWRALSTPAKQPYFRCAERLKKLHKDMFPDYKYCPIKKSLQQDPDTPKEVKKDKNGKVVHDVDPAVAEQLAQAQALYGRKIKRKLDCDTENQQKHSSQPQQLIFSNNISVCHGQSSSAAVPLKEISPQPTPAKILKSEDTSRSGPTHTSFKITSNCLSFRLDQTMRLDLSRAQPGQVINVSDLVHQPSSSQRSSPINDFLQPGSAQLKTEKQTDSNRSSPDRLASVLEKCLPELMDESSLSSLVGDVEPSSEIDHEVVDYNRNPRYVQAAHQQRELIARQYGGSPGPMLSESSRDFGLGSELLSDIDHPPYPAMPHHETDDDSSAVFMHHQVSYQAAHSPSSSMVDGSEYSNQFDLFN